LLLEHLVTDLLYELSLSYSFCLLGLLDATLEIIRVGVQDYTCHCEDERSKGQHAHRILNSEVAYKSTVALELFQADLLFL
jgi:hypothetical protein